MPKTSAANKRSPSQSNVGNVGKQNSCRNCGTTITPVWRRSPTGGLLCNACGLYLKLRNTHRKVPKPSQDTQPPPIQDIESCASLVEIDSDDGCTSSIQSSAETCPGDGYCNGKGGAPSCVGCPVLNNRLLRGTARSRSSPSDKTLAATTQASESSGPSCDDTEKQESISESKCHNCKTSITSMWRRDTKGYRICNPCGLFYKYHGYHKSKSSQRASSIRRRRRVAPATPPDEDASNANAQVRNREHHHIQEQPPGISVAPVATTTIPPQKLMTIEPEPRTYSSIPFTSISPSFSTHQKPHTAQHLHGLPDRNSTALSNSLHTLVYPPPPRSSVS